jgi:hypothetical protein
MIWLRIVVALILVSPATATTLRVRVVDASGAPFAKVLVIVKSLQGGGEVARELTDANGRTTAIDVRDSLYRIIATCPYGLCATVVREFLGKRLTAELLITVPFLPTDGDGVLVGAPRLRIVLKLANGSPVAGAHVLVRDGQAKREQWYVADEHGVAVIELLDDPVVLVAIHDGTVSSLQIQTARLDLSQDFEWQL